MQRLLLTIALCAAVVPVVAQDSPGSELHGRVVDAGTNEPLSLVHVFLDGTSLGDVTRDDGTFRLSGIPAGSYEVVVSYVGFERYQRSIRFGGGRMPDLLVRLKERATSTGEVVVVAERDREWERRLERFLVMFMGTSRFAADCTLLNPEVLSFEENKLSETLTARASQPLRIRNEALGYEVTYWLDHFAGGDVLIDWSGKGFFMPLTSDDGRQERRWKQSRREVFRGSARHFLLAAAADRVRDEEFNATVVRRPGGMETGFIADDFVEMDSAMGMYRMSFGTAVRVEYLGAAEAAEYPASARRSRQTSWITLRGMQAYFDEMGRLNYPASVVKHGYWAWAERMATTLPWDYSPDED